MKDQNAMISFVTQKFTHLNVSQCTSEHAQIGGLLLVHVWDVLFQRLKALLQVRSSVRHKTHRWEVRR